MTDTNNNTGGKKYMVGSIFKEKKSKWLSFVGLIT